MIIRADVRPLSTAAGFAVVVCQQIASNPAAACQLKRVRSSACRDALIAAPTMTITTQRYRPGARLLWAAAFASCASAAAAGFDHRLSYHDSGIWARHNHQA